MISKTIGFRGVHNIFRHINLLRPCKGTRGIVAVFVRSMELGRVLHALGGFRGKRRNVEMRQCNC